MVHEKVLYLLGVEVLRFRVGTTTITAMKPWTSQLLHLHISTCSHCLSDGVLNLLFSMSNAMVPCREQFSDYLRMASLNGNGIEKVK